MKTLSTLLRRLSTHVSVEDFPAWEASLPRTFLLGLVGFALATSAQAFFWSGPMLPSASASAVLCAALAVLVLALPQAALGLGARVVAVGATAFAAAFVPAPWTPLPFAALFALAGPGGPLRKGLTFGALVLGGGWYGVVVQLMPQRSGGWVEVVRVATAASPGLFLGVALALAQLDVTLDPLRRRLAGLPRLGVEAAERWARLQTALARLPQGPAVRSLRQSGELAAERCLAIGGELARSEEVWGVLGVEHARDELETLRDLAADEPDAAARAELERAARLQSDALEQVNALERRRSRLDASLRASLTLLERLTVQVELGAAEPSRLYETSARVGQLVAAESQR